MNRPTAPAKLPAIAIVLLLLGGCQTGQRMQLTPDVNAAYQRAMGSMMAADGPTALAELRALPAQGLTERQRAVVDCMLTRFNAPAPSRAASTESSLPPTAAAVLAAYRQYWADMLMRRVGKEQAEQALRDALRRQTGLESRSLEEQTEAARVLVERQNLRALSGVTAPLQELMIWRKQNSQTETVSLPEESIEVSVSLLDNFVSFGWLGYATCDRHHTGGWATPEGLMVVSPSWDLSSEKYRVSLLAHEAQHFADYRRYPKLGAADLEYRAKLVELILAETMQLELLESFLAQARPDRSSPHAYASHWLVTRLRKQLSTTDVAAAHRSELRDAARTLLLQHTRSLAESGATAVQTVLP
jgi:hypothetical protein